ncbi:MAG: hypothetical protein IPJ37_19185 [Bacteroidales bacterium]|nr:hypothetical protein [Bacteroidales bacterium]
MRINIMCDIKSGLMKFMFLMMLVSLSFMNSNFAQINQPAPTRQSSIDAFTSGNYELAYKGFSQLLLKYPRDPLYKYYSGASLVMLKKNPVEAATLLEQSLNGASVVKSLPEDALFYLGRAQQMSGKYQEAIVSYSSFTDQVGKKSARDLGVPGYIQECENKRGMVAAAAVKPAVSSEVEKSVITKQTEPPAIITTEKNPADSPVKEREQLPPESEKLLDEALKLQYKSDSLNQIAGDQKKQLDKLPESERSSLQFKISQTENLASAYQKSADMKYSQAQARMSQKQESVPVNTDTVEKLVKKEPPPVTEPIVISESAGKTDTVKKKQSVPVMGTGVFVFFEILPKTSAYPDEKIKIDPEVPAGLIYRIQLAVFRNPVAPSYFKGINPVYGFKVAGTDKINYYAGMFRRSADAKKSSPRG